MIKEFKVTYNDGEEDDYEYNFKDNAEWEEFKIELARVFKAKGRLCDNRLGIYLDLDLVRGICFVEEKEW